jgi:23S rRNA (guanosine2251-2'-O)-methyltransferase
MQTVYGIHPVLELLDQRADSVHRLWVTRGTGRSVGRIIRAARDAGIPVTHLPSKLLARKVGPRAAHQGVAAEVAALPYADAGELLDRAARRADAALVLLDRVVDPGNLGSVIRTAAAAGVCGVFLASDGTVGLTPAVAKSSAGAVERLPVARVARPARWVTDAAERGFRTVILDPRGDVAWDRADLGGRILIVAGGEQRGVRPGVARACESRVSIPLAGAVESLNVAIAVGVLLFEAVRQRRRPGTGP